MPALSGYQRATRFMNTQEDCVNEFLLKKLGMNAVVEVADYAFPEQKHIKVLNRLFEIINDKTEQRGYCNWNIDTKDELSDMIPTTNYKFFKKVFYINNFIFTINNYCYDKVKKDGYAIDRNKDDTHGRVFRSNNKKFCDILDGYSSKYHLNTKQQRENNKLQLQYEIFSILKEERMEHYNETVITDMRIFKHIWNSPRKAAWKKSVLKSLDIKGYNVKRDQEFLKMVVYSDVVSFIVEEYINTIFEGRIENPVEFTKLGVDRKLMLIKEKTIRVVRLIDEKSSSANYLRLKKKPLKKYVKN